MENRPLPTVKSLTGLRGLAFLLVFFGHVTQFYRLPILNSGKEGLLLFFVLSAFLLTRHTFDQVLARPSLKSYLNYGARRFFRIYPMYVVALCLTYLAGINHFTPNDIFQHILLLEGSMHFWSIPVEFQYYCIIPFLILLASTIFRRHVAVLLFLCVGIALGYGIFYTEKIATTAVQSAGNDISIWPYLPVFLLGSAGAFLTLCNNSLLATLCRLKTPILLLSFVIICGALPFTYWDFLYENTTRQFYFWIMLFGITFTGVTYLVTVTENFLTPIFSSRLMVYLGNISFSAYLFHYLILVWNYNHRLITSPFWGIVLSFVLTIFLATITYYRVERPFMRLRF